MSSKKTQPSIGLPWTLHTVWNKTLDNRPSRPLEKRNYIYASELGKSYIDRYLKMWAIKPTNPPNERSLRKFQAGEIWEWVVGMILISAGMLKKKQIRVEHKYGKYARVSGRLDYVVGPPDDWAQAKASIIKMKEMLDLINLDVPPFFFTAIDNFIDEYRSKQLITYIHEIKTVSSFMMDKLKATGKPMSHHLLQDFHYVYGNEDGIGNGKLTYICKDDCIMEEFDVFNDSENLKLYRDDIKKMSAYYAEGVGAKDIISKAPPKEPLVLFEDSIWKFNKNWNVEYSDYLMLLYGYETPEKYRNAWMFKVNSWNRVFKRAVLEGQSIERPGKDPLIMKLTPQNLKVIEEMRTQFPKIDKMISKAKAAGAFRQEEEDEDDQ